MMDWFGKLPGFYGFYRDGDNELKVVPFASSGQEKPVHEY
jgi:hypothetical protein